ncbi:Transcription intermediary factor 1-beta (TIF1-beta) (E3 SUMO-protein ligase TRIM28) (KRAB-A-interacting protein) (KRIP-1) (RING-type E3 ubiquitin transferase TIF1-beta) (Tripartite motif-containing protein 28) [Durusdinium trenchii]|uniref:B box-type domain-containing protein n=1 Tax=Durusdinium trenchii TaxID=1381693 RepID=A0ABP0RH09_9DINO
MWYFLHEICDVTSPSCELFAPRPCFHSVCAACLQSLLASSDGDAFDCPRCGRRTQKMQALHQYLPNFDMLHDIDGQKVAQSDFLCEECTSGYRAETYCEECIMNLCESCTKQHRRRRATTNHVLVTLVGQGPQGAEVRNIHRAQYCAIHRTSRYELYCDMTISNARAGLKQSRPPQQCMIKGLLPPLHETRKHRQRVKDIIESLCHKLLDDQALQKLLSQRCSARSNISAAFDELNRAAELRCAELLQHVQENGRQPLSALLAEKERCSAALVDVWCVIDFMEKAPGGEASERFQCKCASDRIYKLQNNPLVFFFPSELWAPR